MYLWASRGSAVGEVGAGWLAGGLVLGVWMVFGSWEEEMRNLGENGRSFFWYLKILLSGGWVVYLFDDLRL